MSAEPSAGTHIAAVSHVGMSVRNLASTIVFYTEVFGFKVIREATIQGGFDQLVELENAALTMRFIARDGITLELMAWDSPTATGPFERRPMNQVGLTHLCVYVSDFDTTLDLVARHGGQIVDGATVTTPHPDGGDTRIAFVTDPDGTRIELIER